VSGRIRTIKPELLEDTKTANLSHLEFRLFVSLLLMADDYGNLRASPGFVRGIAFWALEELEEDDVAKAIVELEEAGLLETYVMRGQLYAHITGWSKHQRVDKPGKPRVPSRKDPEVRPARPWVTYFVRLGDDGPIKIGKTFDVEARMKKLQTGVPAPLKVLRVVKADVERDLHQRFAHLREHGEWFTPAPELLDFISKEEFANGSRMAPGSSPEPVAPDLRSPIVEDDPEREPPRVPARESTHTLGVASLGGETKPVAELEASLDTPIPDTWRARAEAIVHRTSVDYDVPGTWRKYVAACMDGRRRLTEPGWVLWAENECRFTASRNARRDDTAWGKVRPAVAEPGDMPYCAAAKPPCTPDYDRETAVATAAALAAGNFGPATRKAGGT
jgi:hypothetical protein